MTADEAPRDYIIIHLSPGSDEWPGLLAQFALYQTAREGKAFASWACERLMRMTAKYEGVVALAGGKLLGIVLIEVVDRTAEFTLPWTLPQASEIARSLVLAAVQVVREAYPAAQCLRVERQLLPGDMPTAGLEAAGFDCYWRLRMQLELAGWWEEVVAPHEYKLAPWHIRFLDAAAKVIFAANEGTLDAVLYAPFFGTSPQQCRRGLLAILAGSYGPIVPQATLCALCGKQLVGVNLVIRSDTGQASVVEISVDPALQGKGVGRALMVRSLRELKHARFERVELAVTCDNTHARQLYDSLGFAAISEFPVCVWPRTLSPDS